MTRTLAVDAVVPGYARTASDRPVGGPVRPVSHRFDRGQAQRGSHRLARGLARLGTRRSACVSARFGSCRSACVPVRPLYNRPASHRRARCGESSVPVASAKPTVASSRAGRRPGQARSPCPLRPVGAPHPPRPRRPASAGRREVPGVRGAVVTPAEWLFDPGRDV
jgi:hypothetical protein